MRRACRERKAILYGGTPSRKRPIATAPQLRIEPADRVPQALHDRRSPLAWTWLARDPLPGWACTEAELPDGERERAERIKHPAAKANFLHGRRMLRGALAILLDRPAGTIELAIEPDGKPVLEQSDGWHFNLSHADGVLAFAIARCPVGIDVERSKPGRDVAGLMARYFTPIECSQFFALTEAKREASFLRGWTCKEALLKALGTGLRDLQRCAVDLDPDAPPLIVENVPGTGRWAAYTWDVEPGAAAAVALPFGD